MNALPPDAMWLSPAMTRTLNAAVRVQARDGRLTVRTVMVEAGRNHPKETWLNLRTLRDFGVIAWDDKPGSMRCLVGAP